MSEGEWVVQVVLLVLALWLVELRKKADDGRGHCDTGKRRTAMRVHRLTSVQLDNGLWLIVCRHCGNLTSEPMTDTVRSQVARGHLGRYGELAPVEAEQQ